jgi:hypothetical protein
LKGDGDDERRRFVLLVRVQYKVGAVDPEGDGRSELAKTTRARGDGDVSGCSTLGAGCRCRCSVQSGQLPFSAHCPFASFGTDSMPGGYLT